MPFVKQCVRNEVRSAQAARTPGQAARTAAATPATTAAAATAATATAAAAASPATMAAAAATTARNLHEVPGVLLVEQVERRQTHIGDLFLAEGDGVGRRELEFLRAIEGRGRCRCTSYQSESQSGGTQRRDRGLGHTLPLRSLLHPWHIRILHTFRERREICFRVHPKDNSTLGEYGLQGSVFALRTRLRDL